ncbi:hypothetical protein [Trichothermofontia sp.]
MPRVVNFDFPTLADEDLILNAEALFLALDQQAADEPTQPWLKR